MIINKILLSIVFFLLALVAIDFVFLLKDSKNIISIENSHVTSTALAAENIKPIAAEQIVIPPKPKPLLVVMDRVKSQGCVTDGLLSEYNPENEKFIALINRSNCYYLHRAIETWLTPPDFAKAEKVMDQITKKDVVYGIFIAEAINFRRHYSNVDTGEEFDFRDMCKDGTENVRWGEGSCVPKFSSKEYREYIQYITKKSIDLGIQSFTFGQIYMQESSEKDYAYQIVDDMRAYAKEQGVDIIIGAQTGDIQDERYLRLFDYIEGGVGLKSSGSVENGPCLSTRGGCWALLWHKQFASKANNVLLHLDWTGIPGDDLDIFALMSKESRAKTLANLHEKFSTKKTGFMMPYFGVLYKDNGGCRGPQKKFYSPDDAYTCGDEKAITRILSGKK